MEVSDRQTIGSMLACCVWTSCSFLLLTGAWMTEADAFGVELKCPDLFHNGVNTVICRINKTAIREAHCFSKYKSVTFGLTINDRTTVACLSQDYDPDAQCTPQYDPGSCRCQESNGEILTYKFFFLANRTLDEGGQLECKLCILPEKPLPINISRGCRNISFDPPEEVSCEAVYTLGSVNVSCVIGKVYSSRRIYKCRLFQRKNESSTSLQTVEMVTSPTSQKTIKSEVKVSGSCQFSTTLSPEEGCYDLFVSVSPSGRNYSVNFTTSDYCTTTDQSSVSSQQPVMESVEAAAFIVPASVSGIVVLVLILVLILVIIRHVTRKKREG
ncbi:uncharacterized protein LOC112569518 [Pomacea canaliculata]|uniref:uncharacterized protein LOC112569518 n=1 Tax=Pomacea canaliculata TaxID=400727 RepID=UPI000D72DDB6|nr:uncharacterized protein LOC112569518 [Pomacea canaliculata]